MRSFSRFASTSSGFAIFLTLTIGLFMLGAGLGPNALPFPLQSQFSDAVLSHWPNTLFFQQSMQSGNFPLWRNLLMSGQPFAANPLNKVWYSPQWLALFLPAILHLNLLIWLHLVLAGLGMRALGLRLGLRPGTANLIGLAYALAPRLWVATGAGHLDIVYASAWIPGVLWAIHKAIIGSADARQLRTGESTSPPTPKSAWFLSTNSMGVRIALLSVIIALSFFADMRTSVFSFGAGAAYSLWLLWQLHRDNQASAASSSPNLERGAGGKVKSALLILITSAFLAIGLTAVQWLPLLQLVPYLSRNGLTPTDAAIYSLTPGSMIGLLVPERFGFQETLTYVGIVVLVLACIAIFRSPRKHLFWLGLILFGALYALGEHGPLWPILVRVIPPLLWLRVPARAWIVVVVALVILAGFGIEALTERRMQRVLPLIGIGLLSVGIAWGLVGTKLTLRPGIWIAALIAYLATGIFLLAFRRLPKMWLVPLVGLLIVLDLVWMDVSLVHGVPSSTWLDAYQPLAQALHDAGVTRLYSPDYSFPQQAAAYWQIPEFGGVDPFQSETYVKAFETATGTHSVGYSVTLPSYDNADVYQANRTAVIDPQQLSHWNVSHVLTSFPLNIPDLSLVQRIDNLYLYRNALLPTGINMTWNGPNTFTASNSSKIPVNVAAWMPGWNVAPENHNDTAITVQPGQTLSASYEAQGLSTGIVITALALVVTIIAVVIGGRHE